MLFVVGVVGEAVGYGGKGYAVVAVQPFALCNAVSARRGRRRGRGRLRAVCSLRGDFPAGYIHRNPRAQIRIRAPQAMLKSFSYTFTLYFFTFLKRLTISLHLSLRIIISTANSTTQTMRSGTVKSSVYVPNSLSSLTISSLPFSVTVPSVPITLFSPAASNTAKELYSGR